MGIQRKNASSENLMLSTCDGRKKLKENAIHIEQNNLNNSDNYHHKNISLSGQLTDIEKSGMN